MSTKKKKSGSDSIVELVRNNSVPLVLVIICAVCIPLSGFSPAYLLNETMTRLGRNAFLTLSLLIPIMAGTGLNFGMTLGVTTGQIGFIFVANWQAWGIPGMIFATITSIPISILLGVFCGKVLNMVKDREMITNYVIAFFTDSICQLVVLYMMGSVIPIKHSSIKLPCGYGIRNTVSLLNMRQSLGNLMVVRTGDVKTPVLTLLMIVLLCLFIIWLRKTRPDQDMRAVGQDTDVTGDVGIKVEHARIIAIMMSTACAGVGMVIYLQNIGNISTYSSHKQIGMFCIAALLVGGASVDRVNIDNVFLGAIPFHLMLIAVPSTGAKITGDSMIGEYFRVFISYGVITLALIMYETKKHRAKSKADEQLKLDQNGEDAD